MLCLKFKHSNISKEMNFILKYLATLILFSRAFCVKHYLIETDDQVNISQTVTTRSTNIANSKILNQQQTELDDLKSKLQLKNDAFDDMKKETDIYKQQYEGLLEEYQQYLQDLNCYFDVCLYFYYFLTPTK